jgi:hypothetical protein
LVVASCQNGHCPCQSLAGAPKTDIMLKFIVLSLIHSWGTRSGTSDWCGFEWRKCLSEWTTVKTMWNLNGFIWIWMNSPPRYVRMSSEFIQIFLDLNEFIQMYSTVSVRKSWVCAGQTLARHSVGSDQWEMLTTGLSDILPRLPETTRTYRSVIFAANEGSTHGRTKPWFHARLYR